MSGTKPDKTRAITMLALVLLSTPLHAAEKQTTPSQATLAKRAVQFTLADFQWVDAPRSMPASAKIQVLEGNPTGAGLFTMRVKLPAQTTLMPHSHPQDERITVLSGAAYVGFGDKLDLKLAKQYAAGSYYVTPAKLRHYVYFGEETVVQFTGMGPWEIHYLKTPEKKKRAK